MKTRSHSLLAAGALAFGLLATLTGCSSVATRQSTQEAVTAISQHEGLTPPAPLRTVAPQFPYDMKRAGISGLVNVTCIVDETGAVRDPVAEYASSTAFIEPAISAVRLWKFSPAYRDGVAVPLRVNLPVKFILAD
jgi:protein TonB